MMTMTMRRATSFLRPSLPLPGVGAAVVAEAGADAAEVEEEEEAVEAEAAKHLLHRERYLLCELDHLAMQHPPFR